VAEGVKGLVVVYILLVPPGMLPSYIALLAFVWWQQWIQNHITRAVIAPSTSAPPTAPSAITPVLDFEDKEEVGEGDCVPELLLDTIEAGGVVNMTTIAVACSLVAVDSGASKRYTVRCWLRYHNGHTSSKLSKSYIKNISFLLWFEHSKNGRKQQDIL